MRALYANNRGETYLKEVPEPALGESGVLIETTASVLGTGSEVGGVARARQARQQGDEPGEVRERPMSYQSAGRVVAVTPDLESHYCAGRSGSGGGRRLCAPRRAGVCDQAQLRQGPGRFGHG